MFCYSRNVMGKKYQTVLAKLDAYTAKHRKLTHKLWKKLIRNR